ncbi:MAG: DUF3500 domain-containing protein, partial [Gemmataceae bacterium]|nr:DUF3500 domain-containing protein [Gemmataceae bacterium]
HRLRWFFTPQQDQRRHYTRKGLPLEEMNAEQKAAAMQLLAAGLSRRGYEQALGILRLEGLLAELEGPQGAMVRNPGWYFVSIFGEPSASGRWGWRFEGHHLSVNYTLDRGEVVAATPLLFGANPAEIKQGAQRGVRTLPEIEDHARALIRSLTPEQVQVARQPQHFPEIVEGQPRAATGKPVGVLASALRPEQQKILADLLQAYVTRLPEDVAAAEERRWRTAGWQRLYFAYSGSAEVGQPYTYRIYGPDFVVEFLNVQNDSARNPANHIHSAWRRLPADFGLTD